MRYDGPAPAYLKEDIMGGILVIGFGLLIIVACVLFFFVAALATTAKGIDVLMHTDPKTGKKI